MRSFSGSSRLSAGPGHGMVRDGFMLWLQKCPENSSALLQITADEIMECFTSEKYRFLASPGDEAAVDKISDAYASKFNLLTRCQLARMTDDGRFLVNPFGHWMINGDPFKSIYIRQAYKDHWDIIYDHFVNQRSNERVMISGTPGCGKSIEGHYLLHKIFNTFPDAPPPILYAASENARSALVYLRGFVFSVGDYKLFEQSLSYKIMDANGPIWHIYDTTVPGNHSGSREVGPQIMISSPGKASDHDFKVALKGKHLLLYLPLPTLDEMHLFRLQYHNDKKRTKMYMSETRMIDLITKWGCVPRTIFEIGMDERRLDDKESKMRSARDVERMIHMVGSSQIDHDIASGTFLHIIPIVFDAPPEVILDVGGSHSGKRKATDANVDEIGLTYTQYIIQLKSQYTKIVYMWASDYIRDLAFDSFLTLGGDRMLPLIVNYEQSILGGFRGLLLEPFVINLLTEIGIIGRMKNLDTNETFDSIRLGPWKTKNHFQNHSQLIDRQGVMNIPLKGNEAAVDCLAPYDGFCFQITVAQNHGINRPELDLLVNTGIFGDFKTRHPRKDISFVFVVEAGRFENFGKQNFHGVNRKSYGTNSPNRTSYSGLTQWALEVDLRRILRYQEHREKNKMLSMTENNIKKYGPLERIVQRLRM